jgi:hypothetical protein
MVLECVFMFAGGMVVAACEYIEARPEGERAFGGLNSELRAGNLLEREGSLSGTVSMILEARAGSSWQ